MRIFDYSKVKDPRYFKDGRLEAHSDHVYYASESDLLTGVSEYTERLNGVWKFHYGNNYESTVPGFEKLIIAVRTGTISACRRISRWKDMMFRIM